MISVLADVHSIFVLIAVKPALSSFLNGSSKATTETGMELRVRLGTLKVFAFAFHGKSQGSQTKQTDRRTSSEQNIRMNVKANFRAIRQTGEPSDAGLSEPCADMSCQAVLPSRAFEAVRSTTWPDENGLLELH